MLRPLDQPTLWPWPSLNVDSRVDKDVRGQVLAAIQILTETIHDNGSVPQWEVTALWLSCAAVLWHSLLPKEGRRSIEDLLRHHVSVWRDSFRTALAWVLDAGWGKYPMFPGPEDTDGQSLWLGYRSDLRHAGVSEAVEEIRQDETTHPTLWEASQRHLDYLLADEQGIAEGYPIPTSMQKRLALQKRETVMA